MSLLEGNWGEKPKMPLADPAHVRKMDSADRRRFLFDALRAQSFENTHIALTLDGNLAHQMMHGYEGSDVYAEIQGGNGRCYTYTGQEKDGFFYPLHVAAEVRDTPRIDQALPHIPIHRSIETYTHISPSPLPPSPLPGRLQGVRASSLQRIRR